MEAPSALSAHGHRDGEGAGRGEQGTARLSGGCVSQLRGLDPQPQLLRALAERWQSQNSGPLSFLL